MKKLLSFLLIVVLSFVSCKGTDEASCPVINLEEAQVTTEQDLFSKVEVSSLQNKDIAILSDVSQMIISEQYIFVKDSKDVIYVYTKEGTLVSSSFRKRGNGFGEYSMVTGFGFNHYTNNVEVLTPQNMLCYDTHFNFVKKVPLPTKLPNTSDGKGLLFFGQIYDLSKEKHMLVPTSISKDNDKIFVFDSSKAKIEKEPDCSEGFIAGINMQEQSFFEESDNILGIVPPFVSEYLYAFDKTKNNISQAYQIEAGKNGLQASDVDNFGSNEEKAKRFLMTTDKEIPVATLETEKHISFLMKKGNNLKKWFVLFYDKSSGKIGRINCFSNKDMVFPIVKNADKTGLYAIVEKNRLSGIISHLKKNDVEVSYSETGEGDYCVLKYVFK